MWSCTMRIKHVCISRLFNQYRVVNVCKAKFEDNSTLLNSSYHTVENASKKYNVGIFGAGRIANSVHIGNILRNRRFALQWIVDDSKDALSSVLNEHFIDNVPFRSTKDVDSLLDEKSLDAVFVFTPTSTHADYICRSLNKDYDVKEQELFRLGPGVNNPVPDQHMKHLPDCVLLEVNTRVKTEQFLFLKHKNIYNKNT